MRPYVFPAIIVGLITFVIGGWLAGIGFALATYFYGRYTYCMDSRRDRELLAEVRREVQKDRFDTYRRRAYTNRYP